MYIYHITVRSTWEKAQQAGAYTADSLDTEGFIHASTLEQVVGTGNRYYKGIQGLILLCIDVNRLSADLRYELAPGTDKQFPHIYGPLNLDAVVDVVDFPPGMDGTFRLPPQINR